MNSTKVHTYNQIDYVISKSINILNYGMLIGIQILYTNFHNNNYCYLCNFVITPH